MTSATQYRWTAQAARLGLGAASLLLGLAQAQDGVAQGFRIMADRNGGNCLACHALPGQTGLRSNFGPALDTVGARYDAETLRQWVTDARVLQPDTLMPPFGTTAGIHRPSRTQPLLSEQDIRQVVLALQSLR